MEFIIHIVQSLRSSTHFSVWLFAEGTVFGPVLVLQTHHFPVLKSKKSCQLCLGWCCLQSLKCKEPQEIPWLFLLQFLSNLYFGTIALVLLLRDFSEGMSGKWLKDAMELNN